MGPTPEIGGIGRLGRYTLVRPLGAGGMAELFLARADGIEGFSKLCAVKRILPHKAKNERFVRMFLNEARLVAGLDHPNIAHVYDIGREGHEYFFAMEYVHGQDLRHLIHAAPQRRIRLENALHIAIEVCAGLDHAHEATDSTGRPLGIVHRDVSPSNVLIAYQGAVKLVDFGVAKAASLISETGEGVVKGKFGYMSPEQCLGETLDRRSDVYSVGIMLWEMTVGRRLYRSNGDLATLQRVVYVDAPAPSRLIANYPPELERIVMRALARDRNARYQTAQALQLDLEAFAVEQRLPVSPVTMAAEMRTLFRDRINAWREAEQRGRSLADHLAEVSDASSVPSSEHDELDGVINQLETAQFDDMTAPPTSSERPGAIVGGARVDATPAPSPAQSPPVIPVIAAPPPRRRSRVVPMLVVLAVLGTFGAGWFLMGRSTPDTRTSAAPGTQVPAVEPAQEIAAADSDTLVVAATAPVEPAPAESDAEWEQPAGNGSAAIDAGAQSAGSKRRPGQHVTHAATATPAKGSAAPLPVAEPPPTPAPLPPLEPLPPPTAPAGPRPGTMDPAQVRAAVRSHLAEIQACVGRARLLDRDVTGRIVVRIAVTGTGQVSSATKSASSGATPALEACVVDAVGRWRFPAPSGGVAAVFTYPFAF